MGTLLRVNMTTGEVQKEAVPEAYSGLGGRAFTSKVVRNEVNPTCNPLGQNNKLVISPGMLAGTRAPSSGRLSVGAKSPLTGTIKEANAGGTTAQKLASLDINGIIVEGKPVDDTFYLLLINEEGCSLIPADDYKGKGTYELSELLRAKYGSHIGVMQIGPAGEMKLAGAGIANNDPEGNSSRYAGRGGLGAVMGSKGLKAIIIDTQKINSSEVANSDTFNAAAKKFAKILLDHPVCGQGLPSYGTNVLMNIINEAGALPTKNFRKGRFDKANEIGGEKLAEVAVQRGGKATHACHSGCVMRCSNIYPLPDGKVCAPVEYESAWALGAHCEIGDLDDVAMLNYICNDTGLDTIEAGGTLGILMDAGVIPWGDGKAAIKALEEVALGTPLGRIIGNGALYAAKAYGVTRVGTVKGQHMPAYDPRGAKGIGVTYATSTMGADHTAGYCITANILKVGGFTDPLKKEGQVDLSRNLQIATAAIDSSGLCLFVAFAVLDNPEGLPTIVEMLNAKYGISLSVDDVIKLGQQVLRDEREFNARAGLAKEHDRLPEFFIEESFNPHGTKFDVTDDELDSIYNF